MNFSFLGNSKSATKLSDYFMKSNINILGVYDISLQKAVEFASYTDSKAFLSFDEAMIETDVIFVTDNKDLKTYINLIKSSSVTEKIIVIITSASPSDKIYTNERNTHFSLYSPALFSFEKKYMPDTEFILEGFGIRYTEFIDYLKYKNLNTKTIPPNKAKEFYSIINLFTSGIETLIKISQNQFKDYEIDTHKFTEQILYNSTIKDDPESAFFTTDTHSVINTIDTIKSLNNPALLSLYKIIGLNAIEYAPYNKDEKQHFKEIIMDNQK